VEVHPLRRKARVRGIQVHGRQVDRAVAGQRTALNLGGIDHSELHRGMTLSAPGLFHPTKSADCVLSLLPSAKPLKHRAPVHFHAGTAEVAAEVRLPAGVDRMAPGSEGPARLVLREPVLLLPGDRFILRMFSPVITIAGGRVLDAAPPRRLLPARLQTLDTGSLAERLALLIREAAYGMGMVSMAARTGMVEREVLKGLQQAGCVWLADQSWALDKTWTQQTAERVKAAVAAYHKQNPLQPGMPKEDLRAKVIAGAPPFLLDVLLKAAPGVVAEGDVIRLASHKLSLKGDEEQALAKIEGAFRQAGLTVPAASEVLKTCGVDAVRARSLLQILFREKRLVKVAEDLLFHPDALNHVRSLLAARKGQKFSVPEFKDWTGVSRKYAIPLLEYFDRERVTRREGDSRLVL
jgi:selenocysteine-specific elongation factor